MSGKQAKILSKAQQKIVLNFLNTTRYPLRNKIIFLLSFKAGLRSKEISELTWSSVCDPQGNISNHIVITDTQSKGKSGRTIPMSDTVNEALHEFRYNNPDINGHLEKRIIRSERGESLTSASLVNLFSSWYRKVNFDGCSSHSGRRTFITQASRKVGMAGGSLRTVQMLAGHSNLNTTQLYIDYDAHCMSKLIKMID